MSARRKNARPAAMLLAAVEAGDVATVRTMLEAGVDPMGLHKEKCAAEVACFAGREAITKLFVEAFRKDPTPDNVRNLGVIAQRAFTDDKYSTSFAAELVGDMEFEVHHPHADPLVVWGALLEHCERIDMSGQPPGPRDDARLAGKVRLAIKQGWQVDRAWQNGQLPHHTYIENGFIEAAMACVVAGGASPDAPIYHEGICTPEIFDAWPEFLAAVREQRVRELDVPLLATRTRQRA